MHARVQVVALRGRVPSFRRFHAARALLRGQQRVAGVLLDVRPCCHTTGRVDDTRNRPYRGGSSHRQFSTGSVVAASASPTDAGSAADVAGSSVDEAGGLVDSVSSSAALDTGVSYPLWFLSQDGATYQAIMKMNDFTAGLLTHAHDMLGLPWWGTIVAATLAIRIVMLPLNVYAVRNTARCVSWWFMPRVCQCKPRSLCVYIDRIVDASVEREQLRKAYQAAVSRLGLTAPPMDKFRLMRIYASGLNVRASGLLGLLFVAHLETSHHQAALKKHNCYPWRSFAAPAVQIPLLMSAMLGARHLVMLGDESFETGGALWFTDLTVSDPTYVLPAVAMASTYLSLEVRNHTVCGWCMVWQCRHLCASPVFQLLFLMPKPKRDVVTTASLLRSQGILPKFKSAFQMVLLGALPFTIALPSVSSAWAQRVSPASPSGSG